MPEDIYQFEVKTIDKKTVNLAKYKGKVLLIVNVASKCGYTKQYKGLEAIYREYHQKGFEILGFPCNQFGGQEPGTEEEIQKFCSLTYDVSFPMFQKVDVNGKDAHPLFIYLKENAKGILGTEAIKWNFTKFLIDPKGEVISRYAPADEPESIAKDIQKLL